MFHGKGKIPFKQTVKNERYLMLKSIKVSRNQLDYAMKNYDL